MDLKKAKDAIRVLSSITLVNEDPLVGRVDIKSVDNAHVMYNLQLFHTKCMNYSRGPTRTKTAYEISKSQ